MSIDPLWALRFVNPVEEWPVLAIRERRDLPHSHGLYAVLAEDGQLLYIGASRDLKDRWRGHNYIAKFWEAGGRKIAYTVAVHPGVFWMAEHALIRQHRPPLNGKMQSIR